MPLRPFVLPLVAAGLPLVAAGESLGAPRLSVDGAISCPTAAAVAAQLDALMPPTSETATEGRAVRLSRKGAKVQLLLVDPTGRPLARRELSANAGCGDLARAAAVIIASWQLELAEGVGTPTTPALASDRPPAPPAPAPPTMPPPHRAPLVLEIGPTLGAADGIGPGGGGWVPQAGLGARLVPDGGVLGAALDAWVTGARALALGGGEAIDRRVGLAVGPVARWSSGRVQVDGTLGLVAAWLRLEGRRQPRNRTLDLFDPGARASIRLGVRAGRFRPWVGLSGLGWVVQRTAELAPDGPGAALAMRRLPRGEVLMAVGVDIRLRP